MTRDEADKKGMALLRGVESRIVWLTMFLVNKGNSLSSTAGKAADEGLAEYQRRFPEITPDDLPGEIDTPPGRPRR